jgi:predicted transcriptional regulator of viral defense system
MQKGKYISTLLRSRKTVFTSRDISLFWQENSSVASRVRLNYFVATGDLIRIRRGLYVKDKKYNRLELASRVFTPAYVSFETVLAKEGLIFQYYESIFVASYLTREIEIDSQRFIYKKIKNTVLINSEGINQENEIAIATTERAFLDTLYLNSDYHFDNLRSLDWDKVMKILPIYENTHMRIKIESLINQSNNPHN